MRGKEEGVPMSSLLEKMSSLLGKNSNVVFAWENFKCRLCLRFLQEGEGGETIFFGPRNFFYRREGGGFRHPEKRPGAKEAFFSLPAGFTVPTATSRLGQPTNGGNARRVGREKKAPLAPGLFSGGVERTEGEKQGNRG